MSEGNMVGIDIDEREFGQLPQKQQNFVIFQNVRANRAEASRNWFHLKLQYATISGIIVAMGFIAAKVF
jgi:hypothetical protein